VLEGYAIGWLTASGVDGAEGFAAYIPMWGTGESHHITNPDMQWNEIKAAWARHERLAAIPKTIVSMSAFGAELDVRAVHSTIHVPWPVVHHQNDDFIPPTMGKYIADRIPGAKYVELPRRNLYHVVEPWRPSFMRSPSSWPATKPTWLTTGVLATVLFTDIVDLTPSQRWSLPRLWGLAIRGALVKWLPGAPPIGVKAPMLVQTRHVTQYANDDLGFGPQQG